MASEKYGCARTVKCFALKDLEPDVRLSHIKVMVCCKCMWRGDYWCLMPTFPDVDVLDSKIANGIMEYSWETSNDTSTWKQERHNLEDDILTGRQIAWLIHKNVSISGKTDASLGLQ